MGEWLESIAESRGGSGEWESGGKASLSSVGRGEWCSPCTRTFQDRKGR